MISDLITIPEDIIVAQYATAEGMLQTATTSSGLDAVAGIQYASPIYDGANTQRLKSTGLIASFADNGDMVPAVEAFGALFALKRGISVAIAVADQFMEPRGLSGLLAKNRTGSLTSTENSLLQSLIRARTWMILFIGSSYVTHALSDVVAKPVSMPADAAGTMASSLITLFKLLAARQNAETLAIVAGWAKEQQAQTKGMAIAELGSLLEAFSNFRVGLQKGDLFLNGLESSRTDNRRSKTEMVFKRPNEIIGNVIAKAEATKLAKMLVSYDMKARINPFVALGGFSFTVLGDGLPGTGKTSIIQMTCGLIKDYCEVAGYDFHFENLGIDKVSMYQGESAQNARQFINRVQNPDIIGFGTIDDADQVAGKRDDDKRSSVGQQEITAILMNAFDGVNTVIRGNCAFGMFSNYPDKIDDALRQRAGVRWPIDGPRTEDDYIAILDLMVGKQFSGERPTGIKQNETVEHTPYQFYDVPTHPQLLDIYRKMRDGGVDFTTIADLGRYLHAISQMDKRFTGRAISNITKAVKARAFDVDMPDEWFETPEPFLHQPIERKTEMLTSLMTPVDGVMMIQEINRFVESELRFSNRAEETDIDSRVQNYQRDAAARLRVQELVRS